MNLESEIGLQHARKRRFGRRLPMGENRRGGEKPRGWMLQSAWPGSADDVRCGSSAMMTMIHVRNGRHRREFGREESTRSKRKTGETSEPNAGNGAREDV